MKNQHIVTFRITPEEHAALKALADADHRSVAMYVRLAVARLVSPPAQPARVAPRSTVVDELDAIFDSE